MSQSRRTHPRVHMPSLVLRVDCGGTWRRRYFRDLSAGGILLQTKSVRLVGDCVSMILEDASTGVELQLEGHVTRIIYEQLPTKRVAVGMALEFDSMPAEHKAQLSEFIRGACATPTR